MTALQRDRDRAVGWLVSRTVNVACLPDSVVSRPAAGVTRMPAESLSAIWAVTLATAMPE